MRGSRRPRSRLGVAFDAASWLALAGIWAAALAWLVSGWSWRADLVANLAAQSLLLTLPFAMLWLCTRRWLLSGLALLACAVHLGALGGHRAAFLPAAVSAPIAAQREAAGGGRGAVRLLHYNASSGLQTQQQILDMMRATDADVLSILAPPVQMQFDVMNRPGLKDLYPAQLNRYFRYDGGPDDAAVSAGFVVARWPMRPYDLTWAGELGAHLIAAVVERPDALVAGEGPGRGAFGLIAVHPRSPRNPNRWREGNGVVGTVAAVSRRMQEQGLAVVVLTDLNATPSGWRSRELCAEGSLRRAKPLLEAAGTYPDVLSFRAAGRRWRIPGIWPLSVAIDDALVSPGVRVVGWTAGKALGEEHRPLTVDLRVPAHEGDPIAPTAEAPPTGQ